jgi:hypothetical protein
MASVSPEALPAPTLAVMQPYVFPYLGYLQLMAAVDRFVLLDDVGFIKRGWIHRNRILVQGGPHRFTIPLVRPSQNRRICDTELAGGPWRDELCRTLERAYRRAPCFEPAMALVREVLAGGDRTIAELARRSLAAVCAYVGRGVDWVQTSQVYGNAERRGADRILDICRLEGAGTYVNAPGGRDLYDAEAFAAQGVALRFLAPELTPYSQFGNPFVPGLSVIDALMFNDPAACRELATAGRVEP